MFQARLFTSSPGRRAGVFPVGTGAATAARANSVTLARIGARIASPPRRRCGPVSSAASQP